MHLSKCSIYKEPKNGLKLKVHKIKRQRISVSHTCAAPPLPQCCVKLFPLSKNSSQSLPTRVKSLHRDNGRKRIKKGGDHESEGSGTRSPTSPDPSSQRRTCAYCCRTRGPPGAASRGIGPRPASFSWFIHSESGASAPPRSRPAQKKAPGLRSCVGPQLPPEVRALPRFPRARGLLPGGLRDCRGPHRPAPETRAPQPSGPTLRQCAGRAFPACGAATWKPQVSAARLPHRGRKSPRSPLPSARLPSPPRPDPLRAGLGPPSAGRGPKEARSRAAGSAERARAEHRAGGWPGRLP